MFEYTKDLYTRIIDKNNQKYKELFVLVDDINDSIYKINKYLELKEEFNHDKIKLVSYSCLLIGSLIATIKFSFLFIFGILISLLKTIVYANEVNDDNKFLKNDYYEYLCLNNNEIYNIRINLMEKKHSLDDKIRDIRNYIKKYQSLLDELNKYEGYDKKFSSEDWYCLKKAKDASQLALLRKQKKICDDIFKEYLNNKINYSSIHFDNKIDNVMSYSNESKKLMKKL